MTARAQTRPPAYRRWRRWAVNGLTSVFALVVILVVTLLLLIGTKTGTRFAVHQFLRFYNAAIPGEIAIERIDGALLQEVSFDGVALRDRKQNPIIEAQHVQLNATLLRLLTGTVHVPEVKVTGAKLFIRSHNKKSTFADLAPEGEEEAEKPDTPLEALILPISIVVEELTLRDIGLFIVDERTTLNLIHVSALDLHGTWIGGNADYTIANIAANLLNDTLVIHRVNAKARLEEGRTWVLTDGRFMTDRGDLRVPEARFNQITLDGEAAVVATSDTKRFSDLLSLPEHQPLGGEARVAIREAKRIAGTGSISLAASSLSFEGGMTLAARSDARVSFSLRDVTPAVFGSPVPGVLGGNGQLHAAWSENEGIDASGHFQCDGCRLDRIGPLYLRAEASYAGDRTQAEIQLEGRGLRVHANAGLDPQRQLSGAWRLHADTLGPLGELVSLKGVRGVLTGEGTCSGTAEAPDCDYAIAAEGFSTPDFSLASLLGRGRVAYENKSLDLSASIRLKKAVFAPIAFRKGTIELSTKDAGYLVSVVATANNGRTAALSGTVKPDTGVGIRLHRLKSNLLGIPLRLLSPVSLELQEESLRISPEGLMLRVGNGELTASGAVSKARLSNVRLTATHFDVGLISRFLGTAKLSGVVDAEAKGNGPLGSPTLSLDAVAKRLAVAPGPPKNVRVTASFANEILTLDVALGGKEKPFFEASGSLGIHLDLDTMKAEWIDEYPGRISWKLQGLSSGDLSPLWSPPEGTAFRVGGDGDLDFRSKQDFLLAGNLRGWIQNKRLGRAPFQVTLRIDPSSQQMKVDLGKDEPWSVHADLSTKVAIRRLMDGVFQMDDSRIDLRMGGARLEIFGSYSKLKPGSVQLRLRDLDFEMLRPLFDDFPLAGRLAISGSVTRDGAVLTSDLDVFAGDVVYDDTALGSLSAQADWRGDVASFRLDARQKERPVLSVTGEVPLTIDPDSFHITWQKRNPHALRWRITDPDIVGFLGAGGDSFFGMHGLASSGEVAGPLSNLQGSGELTATLRAGEAEEVPITASLDLTEETQRLSLRAKRLAAHDLTATVKTHASLEELIGGDLDLAALPITGSVKADGEGHLTAAIYHAEGRESALLFSVYNFNLKLLDPYLRDLDLSGYLNGKGELTLVGGELDMDMESSISDLAYGNLRADALSARADWHNNRISANISVDQKRRQVLDAAAEIPIGFDAASFAPRWFPDEPHAIRWTAKGLDMGDLLPKLESTTMVLYSLWSTGQIRGSLSDLQGKGKIDFAIRYGDKEELPGQIALVMNESSQRLTFSLRNATSRMFLGQVEARADLDALAAGRQRADDIPIAGRMEARNLNLSVLNVLDLDPIFDIKGRATAVLSAKGTLRQPHLRGHLSVRNGAVTLGSLFDPFTDITFDIRFTGNRITAKNISMKSGEKGIAAFALNGTVGQGGQWALRVAAKARDFRLAFTGMPVITVNTDTTLRLRSSPSLTDIQVRLRETLLRHVSATQTSIKETPENANLQVIDKASLEARERHQMKQEDDTERNGDLHVTRLSVRTADPLQVQGAKLDTSWRIGIQSETRGARTDVKGKARLDRGEFTLFANTFQIEKANAYFEPDSGVDPHLDIFASSQLPDAKIFVRVDGTVGSPRLKLYSEPVMPEETILTMLISGSSEEGGGSGGGVLAGVLQMKYPKLTNVLYERFGIDRVAVGSSASGEGTVVKLGQRVSDKLFMSTGFNLNANEDENDFNVTLEYSLTDSITVDTMTGNESSSVDIGWRVPLGGKGKREIKKAKRKQERRP